MTTKPVFPTIKALSQLVRDLKRTISDDYRSTNTDPGDTTPSMDLTIGWSPADGGWSYQTGDNSFTGGAYGYPVWAVTAIDRRCNSKSIARDLLDQLEDQFYS